MDKVTDNTNEMSFHELFSRRTIVSIPLFQREYVWGEKQFKRMVQEIDIILNKEETNRFLGAVIAVKRNTHPTEPDKYEIVDGQQRLTTLFLFVLAAAAVLAKNNEDSSAKNLIVNYIINENFQGINTKLIPSFADRGQFNNAFQQLINSGDLNNWLGVKATLPSKSGSDHGKYVNQFKRIKDFLQKRFDESGSSQLDEIILIVATKLTFVYILLKDPATATTVFEGLNDTGVAIGIGDLVRNEVFSKIGDDSAKAEALHRDSWEPFRDNLGEYFDKYFFPYALIQDSNLTSSELFRGLRKIWGQVAKPEEIIYKLEEYTGSYLALCMGKYPISYSKSVRLKLDKLVSSSCPTSLFPFLMQLLNHYTLGNVNEKDTIDCLEIIESFMIRRAIAGLEPTGLLSFFKTTWAACDNKPNGTILKEVILNRSSVEWPDDSRIRNAVRTRNIYSSHLRQYLLKEYDLSLGSDDPANEFWIEHIMPQKLNNEWSMIISNKDHQECVNTWGNLIPLTQEMNQSLSQSSFEIKSKEFENNSVFKSARILINEFKKWDKEEILKRSDNIAEWAINRWKR